MLLIKNGRVLDPASGTDAALDILLDGDSIARIAEPTGARDRNEAPKASKALDAPRKDEEFDATGMIVAPGFIDLPQHGQDLASQRVKASF